MPTSCEIRYLKDPAVAPRQKVFNLSSAAGCTQKVVISTFIACSRRAEKEGGCLALGILRDTHTRSLLRLRFGSTYTALFSQPGGLPRQKALESCSCKGTKSRECAMPTETRDFSV
jgi:hypothetical protein